MNARQSSLMCLWTLALAACGGSVELSSTPSRLKLEPGQGSERPTSEVIRTAAAAEHASWVIDAAVSEVGTVSDTSGAPVECLFVDGLPRRVWIPIQKGERFNEVRVRVFAPTSERVVVYARRGQENIARSEELTAGRSRTPSTLSFSMPSLPTIGDIDHLVIDLLGGTSRPGVVLVELVQRPAASFFPDPSLGEAALTLDPADFETRTGYALTAEQPLEVSLEVEAGEALCFEHGAPVGFGSAGTGQLLVEVTSQRPSDTDSASAPSHEVSYEIPGDNEWRSVRELSFEPHIEGPTRFKFSLRGAAPGAVHLIANPRTVPTEAQAPTVLLITSDTHRADHMGTHERGLVRTPALVALAERGLLFEDALSATNITNPSHIALLTGLEVRDHQIIDNGTPLTTRAETLAEVFQAAGWRTLGCVSVEHLSEENSGLGQGFDRLLSPNKSTRGVRETTAALEEALMDFEGEPLFCWLHLFDAHSPYEPPAPYDRLHYPEGKDPSDPSRRLAYPGRFLPVTMRGITDMEWPAAQYRGEIDFLDSQLAFVFEHERFTESVIAFSSDHGECFGAHGVYWDHAGVYPDTVHVPLILSWPGGPADARTSAPTRQIDLGRTLLNLAGLEGADFPGRDLRWTLEDPTDSRPRFALSSHGYSASLDKDGWFCVLNLRGHQKATETVPFIAHSLELYHRAAEPACTVDVVDAHPERARAMRAEIIRWLNTGSQEGFGGATDTSSERLADLAALGYTAEEGARKSGEAWFPETCTLGEGGTPCEWCERFE
ncbi:MAG: sulfatase [Planctomycetes bacterium]|nr:sulfatase [Planctomycetota bacterium]